MYPRRSSATARRIVPALAFIMLTAIGTAPATTDADFACRRDCSRARNSCRLMAFNLRKGCSDLCERQGGGDCGVACPRSVDLQNRHACADAVKACRHACPGRSVCPGACLNSYAWCTDDVAGACDTCNDTSRVQYRDCRHALHPRRCRQPVLVRWEQCVDGCGHTLAEAFAPCTEARDPCLAACVSPGGALLD
jgi:hypothetical protein